MRPDGSCHVWAEFYLDGAGWIPADVTSDLGKKRLDHFGCINDTCIVMVRDINFPVSNGIKKTPCSLLQTFCWWYWGPVNGEKVKIRFTFSQK